MSKSITIKSCLISLCIAVTVLACVLYFYSFDLNNNVIRSSAKKINISNPYPAISDEHNVYIVADDINGLNYFKVVTASGEELPTGSFLSAVQVAPSMAAVSEKYITSKGTYRDDFHNSGNVDWFFYDKNGVVFNINCDGVFQANDNLIRTYTRNQGYQFRSRDGEIKFDSTNYSWVLDYSEGLAIEIKRTEIDGPFHDYEYIDLNNQVYLNNEKRIWANASSFKHGVAVINTCDEPMPPSAGYGLVYANCGMYQSINTDGDELNSRFTPYRYRHIIDRYIDNERAPIPGQRPSDILLDDKHYVVIRKNEEKKKSLPDKVYIMNSSGKVSDPFKDWIPAPNHEQEIGFSNGFCPVYKRPWNSTKEDMILDKHPIGFVGVSGKIRIKPTFLNVTSFRENRAFAEQGDHSIIMIDQFGNQIADLTFADLDAQISENHCIANLDDGRTVLIDLDGKIIREDFIPQSDAIDLIEEHLNYGFIIIPHLYKFQGGRALVKSLNGWELIDSGGNIIWEES